MLEFTLMRSDSRVQLLEEVADGGLFFKSWNIYWLF